jgi:AcrR family transcriptional regulator
VYHPHVADAQPTFRRAGRSDAIELARAQYLAGERVDMQSLAGQLGIGRTTLYRWVGDRDELIGEVLGELAAQAMSAAAERSRGDGTERFLAAARRYCEASLTDPTFREFLRREPDAALRVMMSRRGAVMRRTCEATLRLLDDLVPAKRDRSDLVETMVQVATALVSGAIAVGDEPDVERAVHVIRALLAADSGV